MIRRNKLCNLLYSTALCAATAASNGCSTITELRDYLPPAQQPAEHHRSVDSVISHYFVPEAQERLKSIDVHPGPALGGYVSVNFFGKLASFLTLNGWEENVIIPDWMLRSEGLAILNHEYTHILDYADRNGEGEFVNLDKFEQAFRKFLMDPEYKIPARDIQRRAQNGSWLTDLFGIGHLSEELGWTAGYVSMNPELFPAYLKETLTGMFKRSVLFPDEQTAKPR